MSDRAMPASLLSTFALPSGAHARLRMPSLGEMLLLWYAPGTRTSERAAVFVPAEIERIVDTIDGESVDRPTAQEIHDDNPAFTAYLRARNQWLDATSAEGLVLAQCPHCRQWDADLTPLALAVGLRVDFWPTVDADRCLAVPAFVSELERPRHAATTALTSHLRFRLPSATLDLESSAREGAFVAGPTNAREDSFEIECARLRASDPSTYDDWDAGFIGVQAMLKLAAALAELDGNSEEVTLGRVSNLALCDFLFLDNAYYLTHHVPMPEDSPLHLACANCGGRFAPVQ